MLRLREEDLTRKLQQKEAQLAARHVDKLKVPVVAPEPPPDRQLGLQEPPKQQPPSPPLHLAAGMDSVDLGRQCQELEKLQDCPELKRLLLQ